jgi:hypothetical protein
MIIISYLNAKGGLNKMKQTKLMTFIYWAGIIYFAVRIMLSYLLFGKVESELIFQVFGFWSFLILLLLLMLRERRRTDSRGKKLYMIVLPVILAAALAVVSFIYMTRGIPVFILVSLGSGLLLFFLFSIFGGAGTGPGEKKGRVAGIILGAAAFCLFIGLIVFAFGYNKTDTELILPITGFWLCFIFANAFFLFLPDRR